MTEESFQTLSAKVDELIDLCAEMKRENQLLKANEQGLKNEKEQLLEKNQAAKGKLQSILERLRAMDNA